MQGMRKSSRSEANSKLHHRINVGYQLGDHTAECGLEVNELLFEIWARKYLI